MTRHGSHAYGTNVPTSDIDLRGICVAPKEYYLGFSKSFEQAIQNEPDITVFEIRKFLRLAADCNPNALEILFTRPQDHLVLTPAAKLLIDNRKLFLSKKVRHTFQGYAHSQMKRILHHRQWLLHPVLEAPTRKEFGLPERTVIPADQLQAAQSSIQKRLDEWHLKDLEEFDDAERTHIRELFINSLTDITAWSEDQLAEKTWNSACNSIGLSTNFIELLDMERRYTAKLREFNQYQTWKRERNPVRAEMEAKFGFDGKHAMHLVRLSRSCEEILTDCDANVFRDDAEELVSIRNGAWSIDKLITWFDDQSKRITEAEKISTLPISCDKFAIDKLCVSIIEQML